MPLSPRARLRPTSPGLPAELVLGVTLVLGLTLGLGAVLAPASALAQGATPIERCRQANEDFDYERVTTECALAAAAPGASQKDLVEVYRLLGIAFTALNDEAAAEVWFLRLLALDPTHDLGPSVSPVYRQAYERAKKTFEERGKIVVEKAELNIPAEGAGPWPIAVALEDGMRRVSRVAVVVRALQGERELGRAEVALQESAAESGRAFGGSIIDPAPRDIDGDYTLEVALKLLNAAEGEILLDPVPAPQRFPRLGAAMEESGSFLWLGLGAGGVAAGAGALLLVGGGIAVVAVCAVTEQCVGGPPEDAAHVRLEPAL